MGSAGEINGRHRFGDQPSQNGLYKARKDCWTADPDKAQAKEQPLWTNPPILAASGRGGGSMRKTESLG